MNRLVNRLPKLRLLVCDIQENFVPVMPALPAVISASKFVVKSCTALDIPIIVTEQKPFKPTVSELLDVIKENPAMKVFEKTQFSMITPEVSSLINPDTELILVGIESHVCVLQTALDLKAMGNNVYVVADAVGSQLDTDKEYAIRRMEQNGVVVTTAEALVYELMGDAKHPKFKSILPAVKEYSTFRKQQK